MRTGNRVAYAASVWSIVFVAPHLYWAAGGDAGLGGEEMDGVLAIINAAAIVLSLVAAALGLALAQPERRTLPPRLLLAAAWSAAVTLGLRGAGGLLQGLFGDESLFVAVFEALFLAGGVLFGLAALAYSSQLRRRSLA